PAIPRPSPPMAATLANEPDAPESEMASVVRDCAHATAAAAATVNATATRWRESAGNTRSSCECRRRLRAGALHVGRQPPESLHMPATRAADPGRTDRR